MAQFFEQIDGQTAVRDQLLNAARADHVHHALHFLGAEGSGNLALALAFAAYVLCEEPGSSDACGRCPSCVKMAHYQHPDLHFVFPVVNPSKNKSVEYFMAEWREQLLDNPLLTINEWMQAIADENKQGIISKDLALEIQKKISMKSFEGGYRIALIWMPEMMKAAAANKLLKVLEEPPPKTLFLLVGNSAEQLLPTIISRVQTVRVPKLNNAQLEEALVMRHGIDAEKARTAAFLSDGNLKLALKLAREENDDTTFFALFRDWFRACYQQSEGLRRVELLDRFAALKREGQKAFFRYALQMLRQVALASAGTEQLMLVDGESRELALKLGQLLGPAQQAKMAAAMDQAAYHVERNASPKILFMDLSVRLKHLFHYG